MKAFYQRFKPLINLVDCFLFGYLLNRFGLEVSIIAIVMMVNHTIKSLSEIDLIIIKEILRMEGEKINVRNNRQV